MNPGYTGVHEISTSDVVTEALGLTDERVEELRNILKNSTHECNRITETLSDLWSKCNHPNEYAWCVFMYGSSLGVNKALSELSSIKDLLK